MTLFTPSPLGGPALPPREGHALSTIPVHPPAGDLQGVPRTTRVMERMRPHFPGVALALYMSLAADVTICVLCGLLYVDGWIDATEFVGALWLGAGIFGAGLIGAAAWLTLAAVFGDGDAITPAVYDPLGDLSPIEKRGASLIFQEVNQ